MAIPKDGALELFSTLAGSADAWHRTARSAGENAADFARRFRKLYVDPGRQAMVRLRSHGLRRLWVRGASASAWTSVTSPALSNEVVEGVLIGFDASERHPLCPIREERHVLRLQDLVEPSFEYLLIQADWTPFALKIGDEAAYSTDGEPPFGELDHNHALKSWYENFRRPATGAAAIKP